MFGLQIVGSHSFLPARARLKGRGGVNEAEVLLDNSSEVQIITMNIL